ERGGQADRSGHGRSKVVGPSNGVPASGLDFLAHAIWPVGHPHFADAKTRQAGGGERAVSVHEGNLLLKRKAPEAGASAVGGRQRLGAPWCVGAAGVGGSARRSLCAGRERYEARRCEE